MTKEAVHSVGLLLLPQFQLLAYVLATETLRIANKVAGRGLFSWHSFTANDAAVCASSGVEVSPDWPLSRAMEPRLLLVCAGYDPLAHLSVEAKGLLRRRARYGGALGGLDTGTVVLAELGLLSGYRAVVHWEAAPGFRERYESVAVEEGIYAMDRDRLTAAGGTATGDAMLAWIGQIETIDLARETAAALVHGQIRESATQQRAPVESSQDPLVLETIAEMKDNLEEPLPIAVLAARVGLTARALSSVLRDATGQGASALYMKLRLEQARDLLATTRLSVADVGRACGFAAPAWFSRAYSGRYGLSPKQHRKLLYSGVGRGLAD